jgi:C4-dicarboxylate-specific signal transduction histidine kinase
MKYTLSYLEELKSKNLSNVDLLDEMKKIITSKDEQIELYKHKYENLNVIIDFVPNTISWINKDLTYFGANRALASACNLNPEDFIGRPIGFHTKERFFYEFATELFKCNQQTIYRELEAKISGNEKTFLVSGTKINENTQAVVIGVDITELKNLKGHISLTEKLATLGEMFAGIIHDINNPLMMINASAKMIKKKISDEEIVDILNKIELSSSKISKIINGIKIYIRQDEAMPFENEKLGLILDDAIIICENKLKEYDIQLQYDHAFKSIDVNCNFTQLFQVFVNLISNSADAIKNNSEKWIKIKLIESTDNIVLHFVDSGGGIPTEVQEKIFSAFFTTKGRGVGSGLGLSLVVKILESHGGTIKILKDEKNTTFEIKIPKHFDK